jgi:hypothetical protein
MPYSRTVDQLGAKLTPKLIQAVSQSVIATKRGLMDTEHKLRVGATQEIIDRAGREVGGHLRPLIEAGIAANDKMNPVVRDYLERAASGEHQWEALGGQLALSGGQALLGQLLSNELAPVIYKITAANPNLALSADSAPLAINAQLITQDDYFENMAEFGYGRPIAQILQELSTNVPGAPLLYELYHRGYITMDDIRTWLARAGYPPSLITGITDLNAVLLTSADAALGVLRGDITLQQGYEVANANGLSNDNFDVLLLNTGEPPGIEQLLEAYRRGFIDENALHTGVLQSRIRDEWWPTVFALRYEPLSTADAIQASVQGYITKDQAKTYATQNGLNPDDFDAAWLAAGEPLSRTEMTDLVNWGFATEDDYKSALQQSRLKDSYIDLAVDLIKRPMTVADAVEGYVQNYLSEKDADDIMGMNGLRDQDKVILREIAGEPLSKTELLTLLRRGELTQDQVEQGLRESRLKDKYIPYALDLQTQYPGIYDIRLLVSEGAIDDKTAAKLLAIEGYPADLITPLINAFSGASSTASKAITESMLADLYLESAIDATEFTSALKALGYSDANAALILEVNQWKAELAARNALISKVRTLYVGNKISAQDAENDLTVALVPPAVVTKVMQSFELEREANIKFLSEAQIVSAWNASLFSASDPAANTQDAVNYLGKLGYSANDADILLQLKNKQLFDGNPSVNSQQGKKNTQSTPGAGS